MGTEWAQDGHSAQMETPQSLERGVFIGGERGTWTLDPRIMNPVL